MVHTTLFCQFLKVKMELFKAEREEVLILLERVNEAQRLATMQMKESDSGGRTGRKRRSDGDQEDASCGRKIEAKSVRPGRK
jgi:ATP-dependent RNA helicase DDX47/RRP3